MAQGWAGNQSPSEGLKCALCLKDDRSVPAVTQVAGTLVCLKHVKWLPLPVVPPTNG